MGPVADLPFEVTIVGGGPGGLAAALVLGRMRRRVLVLDADDPAHAVSDGVHGFFAHDGIPPLELGCSPPATPPTTGKQSCSQRQPAPVPPT